MDYVLGPVDVGVNDVDQDVQRIEWGVHFESEGGGPYRPRHWGAFLA